MTDDELDHRLRQALDVPVAPDLVARVRRRVDGEPVPDSAWPWRLGLGSGVATAAVILVLLVTGEREPARPARVVGPAAVGPRLAEPDNPVEVVPLVVPAVDRLSRVKRRPRRATPSQNGADIDPVTVAEPVVVAANAVPAQQPAFLTVPPVSVDIVTLAPLGVIPLEVAPIAPALMSREGGSQ